MSDQTKERCPSAQLVTGGKQVLCKHCLEPIYDNGTVYVHRRSTFDETTRTKFVIESQWCNEVTRINMAVAQEPVAPAVAKELAMAIVADYGRATVGDSLAGYHAHKIAEQIEEYAASLSQEKTNDLSLREGNGCVCESWPEIARHLFTETQEAGNAIEINLKEKSVKVVNLLQAELERVTGERDEAQARTERIANRAVEIMTSCSKHKDLTFDEFLAQGGRACPICEFQRAEAAERSLETAREALRIIAERTCACNNVADTNWHSDRCAKKLAESALSGEGR